MSTETATENIIARDVAIGQRFRTVPGGVTYSRVEVVYNRPGVVDWESSKNLTDVALGYIFAIDDGHRLVAVCPLETVYLLNGEHPGYTPIEIDGIACEIGWCDGNDDSFWCVIRHGCQIGKGIDREGAIDDARGDLARTPWLRGPIPAHFGS